MYGRAQGYKHSLTYPKQPSEYKYPVGDTSYYNKVLQQNMPASNRAWREDDSFHFSNSFPHQNQWYFLKSTCTDLEQSLFGGGREGQVPTSYTFHKFSIGQIAENSCPIQVNHIKGHIYVVSQVKEFKEAWSYC